MSARTCRQCKRRYANALGFYRGFCRPCRSEEANATIKARSPELLKLAEEVAKRAKADFSDEWVEGLADDLAKFND